MHIPCMIVCWCMCVWTDAYRNVFCVHACSHVCMCVRIFWCVYTCQYVTFMQMGTHAVQIFVNTCIVSCKWVRVAWHEWFQGFAWLQRGKVLIFITACINRYYMYMCTYTYIYIYIHIFTYIDICKYAYISIYMYICILICIYVLVYVYTVYVYGHIIWTPLLTKKICTKCSRAHLGRLTWCFRHVLRLYVQRHLFRCPGHRQIVCTKF